MNRVLHRNVPDNINPFMPAQLKNDAPGVGAISDNARIYGSIFMLLGGAMGAAAMYKGHIMSGAMMMAAGLLGGSLVEGMTNKST